MIYVRENIYIEEDYCSLLIKLSNTISLSWEEINKTKKSLKKKIGYKQKIIMAIHLRV